MVTGARGASKLGCLLSLVLFTGTAYYGIEVGRMYWRYYALVDEMKEAARFAASQSDEVIRRTLVARMDQLGIPAEAKRLVVRRSGPPDRIAIRTSYRERLDLPWQPRYLTFRPAVEAPF